MAQLHFPSFQSFLIISHCKLHPYTGTGTAQGELVDRIEHHVASSGDAVVSARGNLILAEDYQHRARKVMCKDGGHYIYCL